MVLAGGLSRRMGGGDKALLTLGGQTLLARVIARLAPQVDGMVLNANGDPARFASYPLPVIADPVEERPGPLAGVLAGLDWAASVGADAIVTVAADTPFFPRDLASVLRREAERAGVPLSLAATIDGEGGTVRHPTFGLWPVALRDDLSRALASGVRKVVVWTDRHGAATARFPAHPFDPFFNVNTPQDMLSAEALLETHDP